MAWKRKLGWIGIGFVATIMVLGIVGYAILRSPRFHSYVLAKIKQQASEATGARVQIQDLALHLSTLSAEAAPELGVGVSRLERAVVILTRSRARP